MPVGETSQAFLLCRRRNRAALIETQGREGAPQPSQSSGATRRHRGNFDIKRGAFLEPEKKIKIPANKIPGSALS